MNIHDCGAPLSRRMVRVGRDLALELENTHATEALSEIHVEVAFRHDWQSGKPTVRIVFDDIASLDPGSRVVLNHTTYLFDDYKNSWVRADARNDRLILLTDQSAGAPIELDVRFVMQGKNCWQALGAGKDSGLNIS